MKRGAPIAGVVSLLILVLLLYLGRDNSDAARSEVADCGLAEAETLSITTPAMAVELSKVAANWQVSGKESGQINPLALEVLVNAFHSALADARPATISPNKLERAQHTISLQCPQLRQTLEIHQFHNFLNRYYARLDGSKLVLISPKLVELLKDPHFLILPDLSPAARSMEATAKMME